MSLATELSNFWCTQNYYQHWTGQLYYTDGVKYLADKSDSHWLIDAIASYQNDVKIKKNRMLQNIQFWKLEVKENKGILTCVEDKGRKPVITQEIDFTDFPMGEIEIWVEYGSLDGVTGTFIAMLKSER